MLCNANTSAHESAETLPRDHAGTQTLAVALALTILVGGALNGAAVHMADHLQPGAAGSMFFGLSPFALIVAGTAALRLVDHRDSLNGVFSAVGLGVALAACVLIMTPSSAIAWCAVAGYGVWLAVTHTGPVRIGAALFAGLALAELWASVGLRLAGPAVTATEADIVAWILAFWADGVVRVGNVVGVPDTFSLVVMSACTTADALPKALVALVAAMTFAGQPTVRSIGANTLVLAILFAALNSLRLALMATSQAWYELGHGPVGASVFDGAIVLAIFALALRRPA